MARLGLNPDRVLTPTERWRRFRDAAASSRPLGILAGRGGGSRQAANHERGSVRIQRRNCHQRLLGTGAHHAARPAALDSPNGLIADSTANPTAETDSVAGHIGFEVRRETGKE